MKIYLDMDGVLTDFNKRYVEKFGHFPSDVTRRQRHFWDNWKRFVDDREFEKLDRHEHFDALIDAVRNIERAGITIEILSSSGGGYSHDMVAEQKRIWLCQNGIEYAANIVPGGKRKAEYASPWNILVDDTQRVIDHYRAAGGTAIHHTNVNDTIKRLYDLHLEWEGGE